MRCGDCKWYKDTACTAKDPTMEVDPSDLCANGLGEPHEAVTVSDPDRRDRVIGYGADLLRVLKTLDHMKRDGFGTDKADEHIDALLAAVMLEITV